MKVTGLDLVDYFRTYSKSHGLERDIFLGRIGLQVQTLMHMLADTGNLPPNTKSIKESIEKMCKGKTVLEIGCREGYFLRFLENHGARVVGTTSAAYIEKIRAQSRAKSISGRKETARFFESDAEHVDKIKEIRELNPDYIVSSNLFAPGRWKKIPAARLLRVIGRITGRKTRVYVHPSIWDHAEFDVDRLKRLHRIPFVQHSSTLLDNKKQRKGMQTFRFFVRKKPKK